MSNKCYLEAIASGDNNFDVGIQDINSYYLGTYLFPPRNMGEYYWSTIIKEAIRHGRQCLYIAMKPGDDNL